MANTDGFGPWKRLFLPDDPPLFKNRKEGAPPRNIHAIQTGEIKSFFDYYLCRPASCFRFAEFDVSLKAFYALMPLLEPARKHADPEVRRWYEGFMELLAVSLVAKKDLSMLGCDTSEGEHEFHASRRMARAAEAVMRGFVDPGDKLCPLNPLPDPDTTWERWAMRVSPVNSWAFSRESFMVSKGTNPRIRTPSFIAHPELYKHSDDRWHSVWGYTVKGRFLPILKEKDPAAWSRLEAAQGDRKIFYAVLELLEHPSPAARVRAAYVLAMLKGIFAAGGKRCLSICQKG